MDEVDGDGMRGPCINDDEPTHSPEGVDLTLIRWMLSLSPLERLEALQATLGSIERLRGEAPED